MISIELPWPPASLNPNRKNGEHWGLTHAAKTKYLVDCNALALQAMRAAAWVPRAGVLALDITFVQPDKRRRDLDNMLASIKSGVDGLALALGVDDHHFEPLTLRRGFAGKPGKVIVRVTS